MRYYNYKIHNPQAITTEELFMLYKDKYRRAIHRMPHSKRFTRAETRNYVFEEFIRQVLLDIIENNTIFVFNGLQHFSVSLKKHEVSGEAFEALYKKGRFRLDYLKSNFMGHFIVLNVDKFRSGKKWYKYCFLSGDLKTKRDKASEIW